MNIYLMRHAHAKSNAERRVNDTLKRKVYLTDLGKKQAKEAAEKLKNKKFDMIFSSQFPRCLQTAEIVNKYHGVKIIRDKRLNEWASGFDGKTYEELNEYLKRDPLMMHYKKGEPISKLKKRIVSFIRELKNKNRNKKYQNGSVLIVSHEQVLRVLYGYLKNIDIKLSLRKKISNTRIFYFKI
ncbi:MAG: histidine phosphatase family protein [Candidatus Pacearchaeota archaeon]